MVTTEQVKQLRDKTGISVMQCRKALDEAGGDMDKAIIILQKKSGELALKKTDRTLAAGTVQAYVHANGSVGAIVVLGCETDFVSGNDEFKSFARDIAMHVTAARPKYYRREDITDLDRAKVKEVLEKEMNEKSDSKDKPVAMKEKILEGKINAYFAEMILLDQPFIKNPEMTIKALIDGAIQKFGEKIEVTSFTRVGVGE